MEKRNWAAGMRIAGAIRRANLPFHFLCAVFLAALGAGGCASPGEPLERKAPVPTAITDLAAGQQGNSVILTFHLPRESVEKRPLKEPPEVEIYRAFAPSQAAGAPGGAPSSWPAPVLRATIPAANVVQYAARGAIRYVDTLSAEDFAHHTGWIAEYTVRTRTSSRKSSAESNFVDLPIYPRRIRLTT